MAYCYKIGTHRNFGNFIRFIVYDPYRFGFFSTNYFFYFSIPIYFDIGCIQYPLLHDLAGPHFVAAYKHVYKIADLTKVQCLFSSSITGAYNTYVFSFKKETIAYCAGAYSVAIKPLLAFNPQPF